MILYVVCSGGHEDYGVDAIFSTEEKAQAFINARAGGDPDRYLIEYHSLDKAEYERCPWEVVLGRGGAVIRVERARLAEPHRLESKHTSARYLHVTVWAKTEGEAIKAANEILAWTIAQGMWEKPGRQEFQAPTGSTPSCPTI